MNFIEPRFHSGQMGGFALGILAYKYFPEVKEVSTILIIILMIMSLVFYLLAEKDNKE